MPLLEAVRLAFQVLRAQKLKSSFSLIGVFIGVTFLIAAWSIVNGMNRYMTEKFGGTLIGVNPFHLRRRPDVAVDVACFLWRGGRATCLDCGSASSSWRPPPRRSSGR